MCVFIYAPSIAEKLRYVAPTRYERQLYYHLLHRMEHIRRGSGLVSREHGVQGESMLATKLTAYYCL